MRVKNALVGITGLLVFYLAYGLLISQYDVRVIPESFKKRNPDGFYDYSGVINVHTNLSSGSGSYHRVIEAAQSSHLDFIFFTDLNDFHRPKEIEGYHQNLLVFVDGEYSYLDSQLLNIGAKSSEHLRGVGQSHGLLTDLLDRKNRDSDYGLFILSHPFKPKYQWRGPYPEGLNGIEVINLRQMWQSAYLNSTISFFWSLIIYPFNSNLAFIRILENFPEKELGLWDELNKKQPTIGILGSDAWSNANLFFANTKFPTYETVFQLAKNHVLLRSELTGDGQKDKEKVLSALKKGQFYMALDTIANPSGFSVTVEHKDKVLGTLGGQFKFQKGMDLIVDLPEKPLVPFDVQIYQDGEKMVSSNSKKTKLRIQEPGNYRVTVRVIPTFPLPDGKKWMPWIFTNPIYILPN